MASVVGLAKWYCFGRVVLLRTAGQSSGELEGDRQRAVQVADLGFGQTADVIRQHGFREADQLIAVNRAVMLSRLP